MSGRRGFLKQLGLVMGGMPFIGAGAATLSSCSIEKQPLLKGQLLGPSAEAGHKLRGAISLLPATTEETDVVIIGGGVAGLSAARWLSQHGLANFRLLELEPEAGGNAMSGEMPGTRCPWGAHYLPLPDPKLTELMDFLKEAGVITGWSDNGLPVYEEQYLCFDPKERLYYKGHWQQGLVPHWGVPEADLLQIDRFTEHMQELENAKGADGRYAFSLPVDSSSADPQFRTLDQLTMAQWLEQQGYTSAYLLWYIDYCCRDDYATNLAHTSAWAGIHYFAGRRGEAANSDPDRVLTWPEGNHWLVQKLKNPVQENINTNALAYAIEQKKGLLSIKYLDMASGEAKELLAKACIMATPQFVNQRLLQHVPEAANRNTGSFTYAPWLVANLALDYLPAGHGAPLSWDNVIYGSTSLGYVVANHQHLKVVHEQPVITYYMPLADEDPTKARSKLYRQTHEELAHEVLQELEQAHPGLRQRVQQLDIWRWGHGMIRPVPGFIWGPERAAARQPLLEQVFFAHSDLGGISVFEEAFYGGIRAAKEALQQLQA